MKKILFIFIFCSLYVMGMDKSEYTKEYVQNLSLENQQRQMAIAVLNSDVVFL